MRPPFERIVFHVFALAVVTACAAAFYVPAIARTGGHFPAPLDDVYIHFGFARSAALGHPFAWIPENGYSSGGTSLLYPLVLSVGYLLGFHGENLGIFAALVAALSLVSLASSTRTLLASAPRWVTFFIPLAIVSVPLADWSFFSGMELGLLAAVVGLSLVATSRACSSPPHLRAHKQLIAGVFIALLFATRPELLCLGAPLGIAVVYRARSLRTLPSLARSLGPLALVFAAQAIANRALTSEWAAAGAVRKLLTSNPYSTPIDVAIEAIKNLTILRVQAFDIELGGGPYASLFPLLALFGLFNKQCRALVIPLLIGAVGALALVSLNATAPYQNFRYAVPSLVLLIVAALLGLGAAAKRGGIYGFVAAAIAAVAIAAPFSRFSKQIDHFARASTNIAEQHVEVARRLALMVPRPTRVLVGDAGAIPYLSGLPALDGLGLGGFHDLPFARASVHGNPAVVELIERLDPSDRPDLMALYPSWWGGLADVFGRRLFGVAIEDNVICAASEKVVYAADWSALAPAGDRRDGEIDAIDVADLVDERAHDYVFSRPRGGYVIGAVLIDAAGSRRFDAGRILAEGQSESFAAGAEVPGESDLILRTDGGGASRIEVRFEREGVSLAQSAIDLPPRDAAKWFEVQLKTPLVQRGDRVRITALSGPFRSYHAWLVAR